MLKQPDPTLHKTTRTEISSLFGEARLILDETPEASSPFGGLASFISFLGQIGFAREVPRHLPFAEPTSNNAIPLAHSLTAFLMAVVVGAQRFTHCEWLRADLVLLAAPATRALHPIRLRRVVALVEMDGQEVELTFLTNHLEWAATSVVALYPCRWQIEVFFKQIKQTLQLADFLDNSARAVRWQVWTALLVYVLLRYLAAVSQWGHSFARLWAVTRSALWLRVDLRALLESYGTAGGSFRMLGAPEQAYLPGMR